MIIIIYTRNVPFSTYPLLSSVPAFVTGDNNWKRAINNSKFLTALSCLFFMGGGYNIIVMAPSSVDWRARDGGPDVGFGSLKSVRKILFEKAIILYEIWTSVKCYQACGDCRYQLKAIEVGNEPITCDSLFF